MKAMGAGRPAGCPGTSHECPPAGAGYPHGSIAVGQLPARQSRIGDVSCGLPAWQAFWGLAPFLYGLTRWTRWYYGGDYIIVGRGSHDFRRNSGPSSARGRNDRRPRPFGAFESPAAIVRAVSPPESAPVCANPRSQYKARGFTQSRAACRR